MKRIDWTKPVRTVKHHDSVEIISTNGRHVTHCILGYVGSSKQLESWQVDGRYNVQSSGHYLDLENITEVTTLWFNFYNSKNGITATSYPTKEEANTYCSIERIACIEIDFEIGEGL